MALLGPMLMVAESSAADLADVLGKAGAFPIAQMRWALRIRTLHATALRRSRASGPDKVFTFMPPNLLEETAVLCVARGGSYPVLSAPIGERAGLIGALSIETAARYLNARDVDAVIIGEGLGPGVGEALLTLVASCTRL